MRMPSRRTLLCYSSVNQMINTIKIMFLCDSEVYSAESQENFKRMFHEYCKINVKYILLNLFYPKYVTTFKGGPIHHSDSREDRVLRRS